jgi:hypothetical protein
MYLDTKRVEALISDARFEETCPALLNLGYPVTVSTSERRRSGLRRGNGGVPRSLFITSSWLFYDFFR